MRSKPAGLTPEHAAQFDDASVVAAYGTRPPYAEGLVPLIVDLARGGRIADLGCGTGELARRLAPHVASIVAIDRSPRMVAHARMLPGGDASNIEWIAARAEDAPLSDAFGLAIAAESFQWFDWSSLCPRLAAANAAMLLADRDEAPGPWSRALKDLNARFSTNRAFEPYDLVDALTSGGWFEVTGERTFGPELVSQSVEDYVTSLHSRNGLSRDRMTAAAAIAFDAAVRALLEPHARDGTVDLRILTRATWGRPACGVRSR